MDKFEKVKTLKAEAFWTRNPVPDSFSRMLKENEIGVKFSDNSVEIFSREECSKNNINFKLRSTMEDYNAPQA